MSILVKKFVAYTGDVGDVGAGWDGTAVGRRHRRRWYGGVARYVGGTTRVGLFQLRFDCIASSDGVMVQRW